MALQFIVGVRNGWLDDLVAALDSGAGAGIIAVYSGTKPAAVSTALSGNTLLAKFTLADPSGAAAGSGQVVMDMDPDLETVGLAEGTATWFRGYSSADGTTIVEANAKTQGTVTETGGGGDLVIDNADIVVDQAVNFLDWTITAPGS